MKNDYGTALLIDRVMLSGQERWQLSLYPTRLPNKKHIQISSNVTEHKTFPEI